MAVKTILQDLSEAPESLHGEYQQKDIGGKTVYVLDLDGTDNHPAVANLKNAFERVKADKQTLSRELGEIKAKFASLPDDFDADEWARLRTDDEARKIDPNNKDVRAQVETAIAAVKAQYDAKIQRLTKEAGELESEIRSRLVGDGLRQVFVHLGVRKGLIDAAIAANERNIEVVVEDGRRVARMKPELGGGEVASYFQNWANSDDAKDFIDPARGGDETGSRSNTGLSDNPFGKKAWSKTTQAALVRADRGKAERLAKAAGFRSLDHALPASKPNE